MGSDRLEPTGFRDFSFIIRVGSCLSGSSSHALDNAAAASGLRTNSLLRANRRFCWFAGLGIVTAKG